MAVTLKDIAREAGVSRPTVSRAMRNDPSISRATCERIQALARKMKYRPDPALTALAAYRVGRQPVHRYGKIGVIVRGTDPELVSPTVAAEMDGIRRRAGELGFDVEAFQIHADEKEQRALSRALYHRGIRGLIVTPLRWAPTGFGWRRFSVVGMGENAVPLRMNYVSYDHDHVVKETYAQLRQRGYRNIGFCNLRSSEERNRFLLSSAYMTCRRFDGAPAVEPYLFESEEDEPLEPWLRRTEYDAIMAPLWGAVRTLRTSGFEDPERLGIAGLAVPVPRAAYEEFGGYVVDETRLGSLAVDFLQNLIQKNQFGIPEVENQYAMLIRGRWRDGSSVRSLS